MKQSMKSPAGGASKHRIPFNLIDFLLIVVMIYAGIGLYSVLTGTGSGTEQTSPERKTIEYQITVSAIRDEFQGKAVIGDKIWDLASQTSLGEVIDVTYSDATVTVADPESGRMTEVPLPGYLSMTLKITVEAQISEGFTIVPSDAGQEAFEILLGKKISFCLPDLSYEGTVTAMKQAV